MIRLTRTLPAAGAAVALSLGVAGPATARSVPRAAKAAKAATVSAADKMWLQAAIEGDRFEIAGGNLAQKQGGSQGVKDYGKRLVADHTTSLKESIALARKLRVKVPTAPTPSMQWELAILAGQSGQSFDAPYADLEAKDHQQDISEAQDEVKDGTNAALRKAAAKEVPTLRAHLQIARALGGKTGKSPV
jgi:putative membrane protein